VAEIIGGGAELETVRKVERLLYPAEHKARQGGDPGPSGADAQRLDLAGGPGGNERAVRGMSEFAAGQIIESLLVAAFAGRS